MINFIKKHSRLISFVVFIFVVVLYILLMPTTKKVTAPITEVATPSATLSPTVIYPEKTEPYNTDPNYNKIFDQQMEQYLKENDKQDKALATIRKSLPIKQPHFTIEKFDYGTNTYSISIITPYEQTKTEVLKWLNNKGITKPEYIRISWIEK